MTSWEEQIRYDNSQTTYPDSRTITINNIQTQPLLGKACYVCDGFIPFENPNGLCERCKRKLKAFVEAEE